MWLILSGSPKGKYSITLQSVLYLEKHHPYPGFVREDGEYPIAPRISLTYDLSSDGRNTVHVRAEAFTDADMFKLMIGSNAKF